MTDTAPPTSSDTTSRIPAFTDEERAHAATIVDIVGPIIVPLARALAPRTEVLLHDLTKMPGTIAAIGGNITGRYRRAGHRSRPAHVLVGVERAPHRLPDRDERRVADALVQHLFHAASGRPVACLCLNTDVSEVVRAQELLRSLSAITTIDPSLRSETMTAEKFPASVEDLAQGILAEAVTETGIPVEAMKKRHKVEVVRQLRDRGFFTMREAVPIAAQNLGVGRHTIYNYLNEIEESADASNDRGIGIRDERRVIRSATCNGRPIDYAMSLEQIRCARPTAPRSARCRRSRTSPRPMPRLVGTAPCCSSPMAAPAPHPATCT